LFAYFATAPRGFADLLAAELRDLGATEVHETPGGASFTGSLEVGYRACLWSRVANRVLLVVHSFDASTPDELYAGVRQVPWEQHIGPEATLACEFTSSSRSTIEHSHFATLRIKDAVVDHLRETTGSRPSVDTHSPDVGVYVHATGPRATVYLDLAGESMHRRGYREASVAAPLRENLAAGILLRAGWPRIYQSSGAFLDPMCGSGTFVIEAAMIACDIAPGILRERFGFSRWRKHDAALWDRLRAEALERRERADGKISPMRGFDRDGAAVNAAIQNAERAGLRGKVHFERRDLQRMDAGGAVSGLVCTNPPYGERLGDIASLPALYAELGERLKSEFFGWKAAVLIAGPDVGRALGIHARRVHTVYNGPIECRLLRLEVDPRYFEQERPPEHGVILRDAATARARPGAQMFANRLQKNVDSLRDWAKQESVTCFRLYDADMPEYAFAIDQYEEASADKRRHLVVQEYAAPRTVDAQKVRRRRDEAMSALTEVTGVPLERVHFRTRRRSRGGEQYEKRGSQRRFHVVSEGGLQFQVNFTDYLDTGLFLDHRPTRALIRELAADKRFLNLFGYTGSASVHAAAGGARSTVTIDLSRTYLEWAQRNFDLNGFKGPRHQVVQADVLQWLAEQARAGELGPRFGLIFLDPPTFSNSKRMTEVLDVQRDHVKLIEGAAQLLAPGGILLFSTNAERFKLEGEALADMRIEDISVRTIPRDFARHARIHQCFRIEKGPRLH